MRTGEALSTLNMEIRYKTTLVKTKTHLPSRLKTSTKKMNYPTKGTALTRLLTRKLLMMKQKKTRQLDSVLRTMPASGFSTIS